MNETKIDFSRILVLSPHTDDGHLGAGGIISRFIEEGKEVFYVVFSASEKSVPRAYPKNILEKECKKANEILRVPGKNLIMMHYEVRKFPLHRQEILEDVLKVNKEISPDLVLTPSPVDLHQDHRVINMETLRAFKKTSSIWGYEHPWNNLSFTTDVFVVLQERHIQRKINALKQYNSQTSRDYMNEQYIRSLAFTRGMQIGFPLAETFELMRLIVS